MYSVHRTDTGSRSHLQTPRHRLGVFLRPSLPHPCQRNLGHSLLARFRAYPPPPAVDKPPLAACLLRVIPACGKHTQQAGPLHCFLLKTETLKTDPQQAAARLDTRLSTDCGEHTCLREIARTHALSVRVARAGLPAPC